MEASRVEVREAVRDAAVLRAKLGAIEGWRDHEILVLRTAGRDAVDSVKVKCASNRSVALWVYRQRVSFLIKLSSYAARSVGVHRLRVFLAIYFTACMLPAWSTVMNRDL